MTNKRRVLPPKQLAEERLAITQYLFDRTTPNREEKRPLYDFFEDYVLWRRRHKLPETVLTIDGFGRLFPKIYPRKSAYWPPVHRSLKCVLGLALK